MSDFRSGYERAWQLARDGLYREAAQCMGDTARLGDAAGQWQWSEAMCWAGQFWDLAGEPSRALDFLMAVVSVNPHKKRVEVDYQATFVDGIGGKSVLPEMWPLASSILDGSLVVSVAEIASAVRLLIERNRVVAEGAGAASVAASVAGQAGGGKIVCVVSGGNIDSSKIRQILAGEVP